GHTRQGKARCILEFGGNGKSLAHPISLVWASILRRIEITGGFTFSTRSAKPTGRCTFSAAAAVGNAGTNDWGKPPTTTAAMPRLATVARRMRRRVERPRTSGILIMMRTTPFGLPAQAAPLWPAKWRRQHYRAVAAG